MNATIRRLEPLEYVHLNEFLYYAVFNPDGDNPLPFSIIQQPELQVYIKNFGEELDDYALCAQLSGGNIVGICWIRKMSGYGTIDASIPELSISVKPGFQGKGIGRYLLRSMLEAMRNLGYSYVSLSVDKSNRAYSWYLSEGFKQVEDKNGTCILVYSFKSI